MRRSLIFGLIGISLVMLGWWFWSTRRTDSEPTTTTRTIVPVKNFSTLQSSAFENDGAIPEKYTCDGEDSNPPLRISNLPPAVKYLAIVLDDPEATGGTFDHWIVWDIPRGSGVIEEKSTVGVLGKNSDGKEEYAGPCPPNDEHRYRFQVFGYASPINLKPGAKKEKLLKALDGSAIITAELFGRYTKKQ